MPKLMPFDDLVALFEECPTAFEEYRRARVCEAITQAATALGGKRGEDAERKLKALQWKVEVMRNKYKNPLVLSVKLSSMLKDKAAELNAELQRIQKLL